MSWILNSNMTEFDLDKMSAEGITIEIVAKKLSRLNRFCGDTPFPYSVAQHCVLMSHTLPPRYRLEGLMHELDEVIMGDIPGPVKGMCPELCRLSREIHAVLAPKFGIPAEIDDEIKWADLRMLATEREAFFPKWREARDWKLPVGILPFSSIKFRYWSDQEAYLNFLCAFHAYSTGEREYVPLRG